MSRCNHDAGAINLRLHARDAVPARRRRGVAVMMAITIGITVFRTDAGKRAVPIALLCRAASQSSPISKDAP